MHKHKSNTRLNSKLDAVSIALKQSIKNLDSYTHVRGESLYVDDVNVRQAHFYI
jgi:xanthine dehydrogenase large subunit